MNVPEVVVSNPLAWPEIRFRYLASTAKGRLPRQLSENENYKTSDVPYLSMEYLRGDEKARYFVSPDNLLLAGASDILLLWDGSNAGEFLKAKCGASSSTMALVRPFKLANNYLFWLCKAVEPILKIFTNGMGIPHVDGKFLNNLCIPCALDSKVQYLIADYLDRETLRIDALVAEKQSMLALLEEKRAALISRAVTRGINPAVEFKPSGIDWLGDIPTHWRIFRLKFVLETLDQGSSPVAANLPASLDELGILKLSAVSKGRFKRNENKALKESDGNNEELSLRKGDVLITRGNTPELVADVAFVPCDEPNLLLPDLIYRLRVRSDLILPDFLTYFLITQKARVQIRRDARGSSGSMVKVSQGHVLDWQVPLPPIVDQIAIVDQIQAAESRFQSIWGNLSKSITLLSERRTALITAAVTGQISVEEMTT